MFFSLLVICVFSVTAPVPYFFFLACSAINAKIWFSLQFCSIFLGLSIFSSFLKVMLLISLDIYDLYS